MADSRGNVTLVALLKPSWQLARQQTKSLASLLAFLRSTDLGDIHFMIIDGAEEISASDLVSTGSPLGSVDNDQLNASSTESSGSGFDADGIVVYQDTQNASLWDTLEGGKDDIFIYDR